MGMLLVCLAAGCAQKVRQDRGEVEGTVRLDGQLVPTGTIVFRPGRYASGRDASAEIVNGKYHIPSKRGPSVGEMVVQFSGTRKSGAKIIFDDRLVDETVSVFPSRYGMYSTEVREIKPGLNLIDFDLTTSDPPAEAAPEEATNTTLNQPPAEQ